MNDSQTVVVMAFGGILILLGIYLILVRQEPGRNRAKFLGVEFELSTPSLVVLVLGGLMLVIPAFVPHRPGGVTWPPWGNGSVEKSRFDGLPWEREIGGKEVEPNDVPSQANRIMVGQLVRGVMDGIGQIDFFAVAVPADARGPHRLVVRTISWRGATSLKAVVWNENEDQLARDSSMPEQTISVRLRPAGAYLVRLHLERLFGEDVERHYELQIRRD